MQLSVISNQILKDIIDTAMVSTTEEVTNNSPNVPITLTSVKKQSARKSLCLFTKILDVKQKTAKRRIVAAKFKHRAMKIGTIQWTQKSEEGIQKSMSRSNVICVPSTASRAIIHSRLTARARPP